METYTTNGKMPNLQDLSLNLLDDSETQYVKLPNKDDVSQDNISLIENAVLVKLKEYPYEAEINSNLEVTKLDGITIAQGGNTGNNNDTSYERPTETLRITENGEYDVLKYAKVLVDVPTVIPENYMEKPTLENVKITQSAKDIDVTNYKSIDTTRSIY